VYLLALQLALKFKAYTVYLMTVLDALMFMKEKLAEHEAYALLESLLKESRSELQFRRQMRLSEAQSKTISDWLERRLKGEPLQHITGVAHFYGLELLSSSAALVPRPETEVLVEAILKSIVHIKEVKILDVATGSGAIALALKAEHPDAALLATDISEEALSLAKQNAQKLKLDVAFMHSDLLTAPRVKDFAKQADIVVANLPYLPESDVAWLSSEVKHDPALALFSGEDGLTLFRQLEQQAFALLKPQASLWLELDPRNVNQAQKEARAWSSSDIFKDLSLRDRFLRLVR